MTDSSNQISVIGQKKSESSLDQLLADRRRRRFLQKLESQQIDSVRHDQRAENVVGFRQDLLQRFFDVLLFVRERDDADHRALPQVFEVQFGDGNIEICPKLVFQTAQNLALIFQRLRIRKMQFQCEQSYRHDGTILLRSTFDLRHP